MRKSSKKRDPPHRRRRIEVISLDELLDHGSAGLQHRDRKENREREENFLRQSPGRPAAPARGRPWPASPGKRRRSASASKNHLQRLRSPDRCETRPSLAEQRRAAGRTLRRGAPGGSTDLSGQAWDSLISSQVEDRKELLDRLGRSKELPTTQDLEKRLWYELQREMTEQGESSATKPTSSPCRRRQSKSRK